MEKKDKSGQLKEILVHDAETGTLKRIKADEDGDNLRIAVPPTHERDKEPRKFPRE